MNNTNTLLTEFSKNLNAGHFDSLLQEVSELTSHRRMVLKDKAARKLRAEFSVGDTVYFVSTCRPTYLQGVAAVVSKFNPKKIVVDLLKPAGRFHKGIICPPTLLTTEKS